MTPTQRASALRLIAVAEKWADESAQDITEEVALLRELAVEPVQEPVIWIQSNHLQLAKTGPFLCRVGPTKLMSDFIPLYAAPQQRKPLNKMHACDDELCVVCGHGITGEPT